MTRVQLAVALRRVRADVPLAITSGIAGRGADGNAREIFTVSIPKPSTGAELAEALESLTSRH